MKIEFRLDIERVTLDDLIMVDELQAGNIPARQLKSFVSRFIVDETGTYLPEADAFTLAGKLSVGELRRTFESLGDKVKELQVTAVPPAISSV
jgi:hypothetical protein